MKTRNSLFALALAFLYIARRTLIAFLFAIFFAYLMSPVVSYLERLLHGRGRAIAVIYALLLSLVVLFFVSMGPRIGRGFTVMAISTALASDRPCCCASSRSLIPGTTSERRG